MNYKYIESNKLEIKLESTYNNLSILDIGGGGEGFIGQIYGANVISIDPREDELLEVKNDAIKMVMRGEDLSFDDESFDVVTLFYSMMYISEDLKEKVISEAVRVLKVDGYLEIWDVNVPFVTDKEAVFIANLSVQYHDQTCDVGYGISAINHHQSVNSISGIIEKYNLRLLVKDITMEHFRLQYQKII